MATFHEFGTAPTSVPATHSLWREEAGTRSVIEATYPDPDTHVVQGARLSGGSSPDSDEHFDWGVFISREKHLYEVELQWPGQDGGTFGAVVLAPNEQLAAIEAAYEMADSHASFESDEEREDWVHARATDGVRAVLVRDCLIASFRAIFGTQLFGVGGADRDIDFASLAAVVLENRERFISGE